MAAPPATAEKDHPAVRHVVALYQRDDLADVRGLGAQGIGYVTRLLEQEGLVTARATPKDSSYNPNY